MNIIQLMLTIFLVLIVFVIAILWKDIMIFLFPEKWLCDIFLEKDGNIRIEKFRKNNHGTYKFKGGLYNMFIARDIEEKNGSSKIQEDF